MFQNKFNEIIEFATTPEFSDEIYLAKEEYENQAGEIYEDDQSYEDRMSHFLEWYIFDRNLRGKDETPLLEFIKLNKNNLDEESLQVFLNLDQNIHGVFQVKKIARDHILVINFFDKNKYKVLEKQSNLIFRKNDLFEARIILETEDYRFTGTYCFHPEESQKYIKNEIEKFTRETKKNTTELKKLEKVKKSREKELEKLKIKLEACKIKIAETSKQLKKNRLENQKQVLETQSNTLIQNISGLNENIYELRTVKIEKEGKQTRNSLMQRFAYMNLKWERSRQIDIKDIYKN